MSVLVDKNTRLLVQGITGSAGAFHTRQCIDYGTNVVAGVTPGKGGQMFDEKIPVFDTVWEAKQKTNCNVSMIFVPAAFAADSILEAVDADVDLVVCITEGIPVMDMRIDNPGCRVCAKRSRAANENAVLACSALKRKYRELLRVNADVKFVFLHGSRARIADQLKQRRGHFIDPALLDSQFADLILAQRAVLARIMV